MNKDLEDKVVTRSALIGAVIGESILLGEALYLSSQSNGQTMTWPQAAYMLALGVGPTIAGMLPMFYVFGRDICRALNRPVDK